MLEKQKKVWNYSLNQINQKLWLCSLCYLMPNCFVANNFIELLQKKSSLENSSLCPPSNPAYPGYFVQKYYWMQKHILFQQKIMNRARYVPHYKSKTTTATQQQLLPLPNFFV